MADPDLIRRLITLLAADLPSQKIHQELLTRWVSGAEILEGWVGRDSRVTPNRPVLEGTDSPTSAVSWPRLALGPVGSAQLLLKGSGDKVRVDFELR